MSTADVALSSARPEVEASKPSTLEVAVVALILVLSAASLLWRAGALSWTWDESIDMTIVRCLVDSRSPFACTEDISQTRIPMYVHAAVAAITGSIRAHYVVSAVFSIMNLGLVYLFARRYFGRGAAIVALALAATSPSLLASGRMLLSHSNVIFTTFSLVSIFSAVRFGREGSWANYWVSAVAFGLAVGSSVLGVFNGLAVGALFLMATPVAPRLGGRVRLLATYVVVATAVFFASTIIYLQPENLVALLRETIAREVYPYPTWNYLELGTNLAPRWYSALLFGIRFTPWWTTLFLAAPLVLFRSPERRLRHRELLFVWGATACYLVGKSVLFRYDAPHQQAPWYPIAFVFVGAAVWSLATDPGRLRSLALVAGLVLGTAQLVDAQRFFPNYLFYGAQYGQRFIGEFYGPAVLHKQGRAEIDRDVAALVAANPSVRILHADTHGFEISGPQFVAYSKRDPAGTYRYAIVDRLHATHLAHPGRDAYNEHLRRRYRVLTSLDYPLGEWAYRIHEYAPGE